MGLKLTILDTGPKTYAEEKARNEAWNRVRGVTNAVFANNGTSEPSKNGSYYPKTVKGPSEIEAGTEAIYEITEFALYKDKEENEEDLAKDKKQFKWVLYIDDVELKNNLLKYISLRGSEKKEIAESSTDFMRIADAQKRTDAILQYGITYFKVEGEKRNEKTKITLKFSKWLDTHKIHIEAYRNKPDLNPKKPYVATTLVKAKPEIIKGYWINENKDDITNSIIGYKETVFMCLKTLGMKGKTVTKQLWEDDYGWGDEHLKTENNDLKIEGRYTYKKLEIPDEYDETYQKQRGGAEGDQIELYFKLPFEKETLGFKDGFARSLKLTTKEKLTDAYFAVEKKREQIKDSTVLKEEEPKLPTTHTVARSESLSSIAPKYNIKWEDLAKENNIVAPWYLTTGQILNLPNTASNSINSETNSTKEKGEKETYYERINTASLGSEVWLVVESANLQGKKATIAIFDNEKLLEKESDIAITLLKDDADVTKLENLTFNDKGQAKVKIKLRKKSDEDFKKQKDKFKDDKVAKLFLKVTCKGDDKTHKVAFLDGDEFELKKGKLLFPFKTIPLNHPDGFKNSFYNDWNYALSETKAPTFGYKRGTNRIHAARDLYYDINEPIYSIYDGVVKNVYSFYYDTWAIEIEHNYEYKSGYKLYVRYGEVSKNNILVKTGDTVTRGQKIAEVGLLIPYVKQPNRDKRGMLHIEMYTGEETGKLTDKTVKYSDMMYAASSKYSVGRTFQRRKDLFDPLELLNEGYLNSKNEGLIK